MDLTARLRGKRIASVLSNGHLLSFVTDTKEEVVIAWVDDNGNPIKGRPVVHSSGGRMNVRSMLDLIRVPR